MVRSRCPTAAPAAPPDTEVGFAKLQGEDFEYYMQTYSITLGRLSRKHPCQPDADAVDVDLGSLGGGMNVSRRHARIFYDFPRRRFALEVLGKNGCLVEGVLYSPGEPPVKLDSQDLLQMGDAQFYFLLPSRSVFDVSAAPARHAHCPRLLPPPSVDDDDEDDDGEEGEEEAAAKRARRGDGEAVHPVRRSETRSRAYREADDQQLLQLEEKDVLSSVATVLSDLCAPGDWMPMDTLHEVMFENYGNLWHHSRVRKYLTSEDWPGSETDDRPWFGLLTLLRKYPENFAINVVRAGQMNTDLVPLVSLLP